MYRVFLIDDEPWAMISLEHLIDWESLGFHIDAKLDSARLAWERIQQDKPDVIITDIRMPSLSGLELLERIHQADLAIPIILVSAFADFSYAQDAIRMGAFEYLLKPVRRDRLTECMNNLHKRLVSQRLQQVSDASVERRAILTRGLSIRDTFEQLSGRAVPSSAAIAVFSCTHALAAMLMERGISEGRYVSVDVSEEEHLFFCYNGDFANLADQCLQLCQQQKMAGGFGITAAQNSEELCNTLLWQARCARQTAAFIGKAGLISTGAGFTHEVELLKALEHNQRSRVLPLLQMLQSEVQSGHLMGDQLFALLRSMERFFSLAQKDAVLCPPTWTFYTDMFKEYPQSTILFSRLLNIFGGDDDAAFVAPVLEEVSLRYARARNLADLADELNVSQSALSQLVRKHTGKTYSELIQEARMNKAKELLAFSDASVMAIAIQIGYSDQFYFSKLFKRLYGMSPNAYRKQVCSGNEITKTQK